MKLFKAIFVLLFLFLVIAIPAVADDVNPKVEMKQVYEGRILLEKEKFPLEHYSLESYIASSINPFSSANIDKAKLAGVNALWGFNKMIASFTMYAVSELMTFDLISQVTDQIAIISERINNQMIQVFLSMFVVLVGGVSAYRYFAKQRIGEAYTALISAVIILVVSNWFFSNTAGNIKMINSWGSQLEGYAASINVVFSSTDMNNNNPYSAKESSAILENQLFDLMVKRPYLLLNYGTSKETDINKQDANRVNNLLAYKPYNDQGITKRQEIIKREYEVLKNKFMSPNYNNERFGIVFLTILSTIGLSIPILILASAKFLLQILLLALLIFAAIPLTIAIIPTYSETAWNYFKKIFGVLLMKAGLMLLMAVMVGLLTLIYESFKATDGVESFTFVIFLMIITTFGLWKYKSQVFEVASNGYMMAQNEAKRITYDTQKAFAQTGQKGARITGQGLKKTGEGLKKKGGAFLSNLRSKNRNPNEANKTGSGNGKQSSANKSQNRNPQNSKVVPFNRSKNNSSSGSTQGRSGDSGSSGSTSKRSGSRSPSGKTGRSENRSSSSGTSPIRSGSRSPSGSAQGRSKSRDTSGNKK